MRVVLSVLVVLLSILLWRTRLLLKNSLGFADPNLPLGYYNKGDFNVQCVRVKKSAEQLKYCEDATFWDQFDGAGKLQKRSVLISCDAGRKEWNVVHGPRLNPELHGSLWIHVPSQNVDPTRLILKNYPVGHDFHPIGLQASPSHAGNSSNLYVANHARNCTCIEHFTLVPSSPTAATYVRTICSPYVNAANALALTSSTSFFVTNDHFAQPRLPIIGPALSAVETFLTLPFGWVSHLSLDPDHASVNPIKKQEVASSFLTFPNGIAISPDGSRVAVASVSLSLVRIYTRNPDTNTLALADNVHVPFLPDNVHYDDEGNLIIAGISSIKAFDDVAFKRIPTDESPTWIVSLKEMSQTRSRKTIPQKDFDLLAPVSASSRISGSHKYAMETLFQSNGTGFPTSTTGLLDSKSGTLYLAGIYAEDGVMICKPKA